MNLLIDRLPRSVKIGEKEYPINADFRFAVRSIMAFEDNTLTDMEKQMILIANLYPERPADLMAAFERGVWFLNGGKDTGEVSGGPRVYSFEKDSSYIFSAFRQTHNIDLDGIELHWWKFMALFMDLGADTVFCNLINLRKRVKTGTATKEERQAYREMREQFDLEEIDTRSLKEKEQEAEFMRLIGSAQQERM